MSSTVSILSKTAKPTWTFCWTTNTLPNGKVVPVPMTDFPRLTVSLHCDRHPECIPDSLFNYYTKKGYVVAYPHLPYTIDDGDDKNPMPTMESYDTGFVFLYQMYNTKTKKGSKWYKGICDFETDIAKNLHTEKKYEAFMNNK